MPKLNYTISGNADAPWVTLSHSLATDMRMWEPQLPALETRFQILRYDARGHGGSPLGEESFDIDTLVQDVIGLWDELSIERSHFLGLSMGGMTGVGLALRCPERMDRLAACDCRLDAPDFFRNMWDQRIAQIEASGMTALVDDIIATWLCEETLAGEGNQETVARQLILDTPRASYIACARALKTLNYKQDIANITVPVLYLVGEQDGGHPEEMHTLTELTPNARFLCLKNAAHLSNLEKPLAFNRAILDFLLETDSSYGT